MAEFEMSLRCPLGGRPRIEIGDERVPRDGEYVCQNRDCPRHPETTAKNRYVSCDGKFRVGSLKPT